MPKNMTSEASKVGIGALIDARVCADVPTADLKRARRFYEKTLGLRAARSDEERGVYYQAGGDNAQPLRDISFNVISLQDVQGARTDGNVDRRLHAANRDRRAHPPQAVPKPPTRGSASREGVAVIAIITPRPRPVMWRAAAVAVMNWLAPQTRRSG